MAAAPVGRPGFFDGEPGDTLVFLEGARAVTEGVAAHRAQEADLAPGAGGGDRLVAALAAGAGAELAEDRFAGFREIAAMEGEVLDEAADDEDLHGRKDEG